MSLIACVFGTAGPVLFNAVTGKLGQPHYPLKKMYAAAAESSCSNWLLFPFLLWIIPVEYFQSIGKRKNVKPINTQAGMRNGETKKML